MDLSGLTEHLAAVEDDAALELPLGDRTYRVRPPSVAVGTRCAAIWAARGLDDREERQAAVAEGLNGSTLPDLTLGSDVVEQMTGDGVPAVVVHECAMVALVAWVAGPEAAQRYLDRSADRKAADAPGEAKKSRSRKRSGTSSGTRSGSASKTR